MMRVLDRIWVVHLLVGSLALAVGPAQACTTILVGRAATGDGSVLMATSCDGGIMGRVYVLPAAEYPQGTTVPMFYDFPAPSTWQEHLERSEARGYAGRASADRTDLPLHSGGGAPGRQRHRGHQRARREHGHRVHGHEARTGEPEGQSQHVQQSLDHVLDRQRVDAGEDRPGGDSPDGRDGREVRVHVLLGSGRRVCDTGRGPEGSLDHGDLRSGQGLDSRKAGSPAPSGAHSASRTAKPRATPTAAGSRKSTSATPTISSRRRTSTRSPRSWGCGSAANRSSGTRCTASSERRGNSLREWAALNALAPSLRLQATGDPQKDRYPFSVKPDGKVNVQTLTAVMRDCYQGTKFDVTEHPAFRPRREAEPAGPPAWAPATCSTWWASSRSDASARRRAATSTYRRSGMGCRPRFRAACG